MAVYDSLYRMAERRGLRRGAPLSQRHLNSLRFGFRQNWLIKMLRWTCRRKLATGNFSLSVPLGSSPLFGPINKAPPFGEASFMAGNAVHNES